MNSGIYLIINTKTNCVYVGSAVDIKRRFRQHRHQLRNNKHYSTYLQRSWNKHKEENFKFTKFFSCSKKDLIKYEKIIFKYFNKKYNLSKIEPTRLGSKHSKKTREKLSKAHKGRISLKKGVKTGKPAWNRGIAPSKEQIDKQRKSMRGRRVSRSTEFKKGREATNKKPIKCIELNKTFESITEAAIFLGNEQYQFNINSCARGKQKTAYSYKWTFDLKGK